MSDFIDWQRSLEQGLALSPPGREMLAHFCRHVRSIERVEGSGWKLGLPPMEDGEPLDDDTDELVRLQLSGPSPYAPAPGMPASIAALVRLHTQWELLAGEERKAFFGGLTQTGRLESNETITDPDFEPAFLEAHRRSKLTSEADNPVVVECWPNGWAVVDVTTVNAIGEPTLRWLSDEVRRPGVALWPNATLGEAVVLTVLSTALGHHPRWLNEHR